MSAVEHVLRQLAERYRGTADLLRTYGQAEPAALLSRVADELVAEGEAYVSEPLTLEEAAEESGYSYSRIQTLVADGTIPNAGEKGNPRIRRGDLPRKPTRLMESEREEEDDSDDFASELLRRRIG